jgi:cytochrome c oxidase subunit 4
VAEKNKQDGGESAEQHHGAGRYVLIWAALLVFTLTTVITGRMDLGSANLPLALIIATVKATLVVLFFMHLWDSEGINRLVFCVALIFVLVLLAGVFGDLLTRMPDALPTGQHAHTLEDGDLPTVPALNPRGE